MPYSSRLRFCDCCCWKSCEVANVTSHNEWHDGRSGGLALTSFFRWIVWSMLLQRHWNNRLYRDNTLHSWRNYGNDAHYIVLEFWRNKIRKMALRNYCCCCHCRYWAVYNDILSDSIFFEGSTEIAGPDAISGKCWTWKCGTRKPETENGEPAAGSWLFNLIGNCEFIVFIRVFCSGNLRDCKQDRIKTGAGLTAVAKMRAPSKRQPANCLTMFSVVSLNYTYK